MGYACYRAVTSVDVVQASCLSRSALTLVPPSSKADFTCFLAAWETAQAITRLETHL